MSGGTRTWRRRSPAPARAKRIFGYHICDWLVPTKDLLLDRGMMGDGVIDFPRIRGWIEQAGYTGLTEVEIFSAEDWWTTPGDEVLRTVHRALQRHIIKSGPLANLAKHAKTPLRRP